jgi:integrase
VSAFLKQQSVGHRPKKSKAFTLEEMERFLDTASDDEYLLLKVVLIVGVFGGCRIGELVSMLVDHVDDRGSVIVVEIPDTKTHKPRRFTIINGNNTVHAVDVFRKYKMLRPENISHKRLFINYRNKKCTVQPVGVNTLSKFLQKMAQFIGLQNPEEYTGHSFRRSSATLLADSGADITVVKRHGGWRSNSVVEGYIEDSLNNKIEISRKIINQSSTIIQNESALDLAACSSGSNAASSMEINHQDINLPVHRRFGINFSNVHNCKFYITDTKEKE